MESQTSAPHAEKIKSTISHYLLHCAMYRKLKTCRRTRDNYCSSDVSVYVTEMTGTAQLSKIEFSIPFLTKVRVLSVYATLIS
jgi:hypothetical protein